MLRTHIVTLWTDWQPIYPEECVACGARDPDSVIRCSDRAFVAGSILFFWLHFTGRKERREFPACRRCRVKDGFVRWGRLLLAVAFLWAVMDVVLPWTKTLDVPRDLQRFLGIAILVAACAPLLLWSYVFPRAVRLDVKAKAIDYEFARGDYADRFRALNTSQTRAT